LNNADDINNTDNINNANDIDNTDDIDKDDNLILDKLHDAIKTLHLFNAMGVKEFLTILKENIIYEDDQIITEFVNIFKSNKDGIKNLNNIDNSIKVLTISIKVTLKSLKNIHIFLFQ